MNNKGICYLIGAGPGDPGLLTLRAVECLQQADEVFYDNLASDETLQYVSKNAILHYVGKKAGCHSVPQEDICRMLVESVAAGKVVARLKGGDPFVFGRGGEEALALADAGLLFEIIPGVTSGIAAAAYAGIPVTHRNTATSVTFVTGHEMPGKDETQTDWKALAATGGTLCIYMGVGNLGGICKQLIAGGRDNSEPVAIIRYGTANTQWTLTGTLTDIVEKVEKSGMSAPAMVIVGEVVKLRENLQWFERRPLLGKKILVTRARAQASSFCELLRKMGAIVRELPCIEIAEAKDVPPLEKALRSLSKNSYDWVVFTSVNGVEYSFARMLAMNLDARAVRAKVAAIGPATAEALAVHGIVADLCPEKYTGEALLAEMLEKGVGGSRVLLLRADNAREMLRIELEKAGAEVHDICAYSVVEKCLCADAVKEIIEWKPDFIPFASSGTVRGFADLLKSGLEEILQSSGRPKFASIGPITSQTMREIGIPVDFEAEESTIPALARCLAH